MSIFLSGACISFTHSFTISFLLDIMVATEPCVILHILVCVYVCVCGGEMMIMMMMIIIIIINFEWIYSW